MSGKRITAFMSPRLTKYLRWPPLNFNPIIPVRGRLNVNELDLAAIITTRCLRRRGSY